MDRVTESMVKSFSSKQEISLGDNSLLFEYFVNYCVVYSVYGSDDFDLEEITTGKGTPGIDGIAIIVNQKLVQSTEDIDLLIRLNKTLYVKFVLIQSKTSDSFDNTEIGNMMTYANEFFNVSSKVFSTTEMKRFIEIKDYIFDKCDKLIKNPELLLYFVTTGTWSDGDDNLKAPVQVGKDSLEQTHLFSNVEFLPCGSNEIQDLYRKSQSPLRANFRFEKRITMYSINDDEVGYSGVLPFSEFKKLLLDESGHIKPVFEDNIRDYLGLDQDINKEIRDSALSKNRNAFCMLNNGITIVADSISIVGDNATAEDYQIVNGCQTSNILLSCMDDNSEIGDLIIPIRIIATKDEYLKNDITRATNSQTSIKKEQLEALSSFQRRLEEYYKTYTCPDALVYERRTGQYRNTPIPKTRIVTIQTQIKTIAAMFLDEPSAVSGQYGTIAKRVGDKIFKSSDRQIMYYTSSLALYRIEALFRSGVIDKKYRRSRYHAMMLLRIVSSPDPMPKFNQKKMEPYCGGILKILNDPEKCERYYKKIVAFIINQEDIDNDDRKCFERKDTTDILLSKIDELRTFIAQ